MTPGHEALAVLRELLNLVDARPGLALAAKLDPAFTELLARSRGIVLVSNDTLMAQRPLAAEVGWCGQCRAFHAKGIRAVNGKAVGGAS